MILTDAERETRCEGDFDALCAEIEERPGAAERINADVRSMTARHLEGSEWRP